MAMWGPWPGWKLSPATGVVGVAEVGRVKCLRPGSWEEICTGVAPSVFISER
jgi:hypothetical protein